MIEAAVDFNFVAFLTGMFCLWLVGCWVHDLISEFKDWLDAEDE